MKQLIEYIVSNLVNHPEDVVIEEIKTADEDGSSSIIIQVNPEDIGRVIGKSGKVINAIRQIARIAAIQKGVRVRVDLKDDNRQAQPAAEEIGTEPAPAHEAPSEPTDKDAAETLETPEATEPAPTLEDEPEA